MSSAGRSQKLRSAPPDCAENDPQRFKRSPASRSGQAGRTVKRRPPLSLPLIIGAKTFQRNLTLGLSGRESRHCRSSGLFTWQSLREGQHQRCFCRAKDRYGRLQGRLALPQSGGAPASDSAELERVPAVAGSIGTAIRTKLLQLSDTPADLTPELPTRRGRDAEARSE
jgi:hypothetical protein